MATRLPDHPIFAITGPKAPDNLHRMKRVLLLPALFSIVPMAQAQLALLQDLSGNTVNGQLVEHWGDNATSNQEVDIHLTLNGNVNKTVNVRRYELAVGANTENYFCWGVCYAPQLAGALPVWNAQPQHAIQCQPGVEVTNFHAYHNPNGVNGSSTYRYVWYDVANPLDTAFCDIRFQVTPVGLDELAVEQFTAFPNPAEGQDAQVRFALTPGAAGATLFVHNMVGEEVFQSPLRSAAGRVMVPTARFVPGVYFASLRLGGRSLATIRLVVSGH